MHYDRQAVDRHHVFRCGLGQIAQVPQAVALCGLDGAGRHGNIRAARFETQKSRARPVRQYVDKYFAAVVETPDTIFIRPVQRLQSDRARALRREVRPRPGGGEAPAERVGARQSEQQPGLVAGKGLNLRGTRVGFGWSGAASADSEQGDDDCQDILHRGRP